MQDVCCILNMMLCPNCSQKMEPVELSNQKVLSCSNCGGSFFPENSINRISQADAHTLTRDIKNNIVMGTPKICPTDNIFLHLIENDEAIPQNVSLLKCPKCNGIFAHADDLMKFKSAQDVKISFFKAWQTALPSLKSVLVLSFIAVIGLTAFSNLSNRSTESAKAADIIETVSFTNQGRYLFVNFRTDIPYTSTIVIVDKTAHREIQTTITTELTQLHYSTITNVNLHNELYYKIILNDGRGTEIQTAEQKLVLP